MSYTEITQAQFEDTLNRQGYKWKISEEKFAKETVYLLDFKNVMIKVFSSLEGGVSREVGSDAIRVIGIDTVSNLPVSHSEQRVYRTQGWRENLISRINTVKDKMSNIQICNICGSVMVERVNSTTRQTFMGCLNWKGHNKKENKVERKVENVPDRNTNIVHNPVENIVSSEPPCMVTNMIRHDPQVAQIPIKVEKSPSGDVYINKEGNIMNDMTKNNYNAQNYNGIIYHEVIGNEPLMITNEFKYGKFAFEKFNPIQSRLYEFVPKDYNIVVESKTSTGKTQMGEMFMWYVLGSGKKVIYTSPLKALTREKWDSWSKKFGDSGYKLSIITGDYKLTDKRIKELNESNIILCTSEMLDHRTRNMISEKSEWLRNAGLLILDEMQMIGTKGRGDKLEAGLIRFTKINQGCKVLVLSGTMPNSIEIARWIKDLNEKETVLIRSNWRPIKLNMRYIPYDDSKDYYTTKDNLFMEVKRQVGLHRQDKILVFVHSKTDGHRIKAMLEGGGYSTAFHNADLDSDERINIEDSFKNRGIEGVRIIIATSTLAYGLNMPARIVLIAGAHRGLDEVSELDIIQMCGRSGRMGIDVEGDAIMIFPESQMGDLREKVENPGDIMSQINEPMIAAFHVIGEIVNRTIKTREDVYQWYSRTLASRQNMKISKEYVDMLVDYLLDNNAIRETEMGGVKRLIETQLGKACCYFYLSPAMLKDLMTNWDKMFELKVENSDFLVSIAMSKIRLYNDVIVSKADKGVIASYFRATNAVKDTLGEVREGQAKIGNAYLNIIKGIGAVKIEEDGKKIPNPLASVQRGLQQDVERIMQALMYLDAKYAKWDKVNYLSVIGLRMRYGVGPELVDLCSLSGVGGIIAKKLYDGGIKKPIELITKKPFAIAAIGVRYFGIIEKNKETFQMLGYKVETNPDPMSDTKKLEGNKEVKKDTDNITLLPNEQF